MVTLDSLAEYPDIGTGGTQWKRATAIISDLYQRCPSRTFAQNQTGEGVWKCQSPHAFAPPFQKLP
jgi:hypothetical protein